MVGKPVSIGFGGWVSPCPLPETYSAAIDQATPDDLISFLKAIPDSHLTAATTAAVRYPQWFLLLLAVLGILSGCRSCRDLEAFPSGTGRP